MDIPSPNHKSLRLVGIFQTYCQYERIGMGDVAEEVFIIFYRFSLYDREFFMHV